MQIKSRMKKLVIFDLDGTLLNTIADLANSTNYALNKLGYPTHEVAKYNFMVGNGIDKLFERALPEGDRKSTRLNSSHANISYAVFCLKKKKDNTSELRSRQ